MQRESRYYEVNEWESSSTRPRPWIRRVLYSERINLEHEADAIGTMHVVQFVYLLLPSSPNPLPSAFFPLDWPTDLELGKNTHGKTLGHLVAHCLFRRLTQMTLRI